MANIKPVSLNKGKHNSKERAESRQKAEDSLKCKPISRIAPNRLSKNGKTIYSNLLKSFPDGFLTASDSHTLEIVANAIDMMQISQKDINERGFLLDEDIENPSIRVYERYTKIFNTFGSKLGMSPRDRASLAVLLVNQQEEKEDPLLDALKRNKK